MSSDYAWTITKDHDPDAEAPPGTNLNALGVQGPFDAPQRLLDRVLAEGKAFRIRDSDGNVYYTGKIIDPKGENEMAPLDDFGHPNAGASDIQYRNEAGEWESL